MPDDPAAAAPAPPALDRLLASRLEPGGGLLAVDVPASLVRFLADAGYRVLDVSGDDRAVAGIIAGPADADALLARLSRAWESLPGEATVLLAGVFDLAAFRDGYRGFPALEMIEGIAARAGFDVMENLAFDAGDNSLDLAGFRNFRAVHGAALAAGTLGPRLLRLRRLAEVRWRVSHLPAEHFASLARLYQEVFGHAVDPQLWQWKYAEGRGTNAVAWSGGRIVAHYGAVRRRILYRGRAEWAAQPADVLVESRERAVLTRRGPFYLTALTQAQVNSGPCLIGFGFPGGRAMQVAVRLGLYRPVARMIELVWPAAPSGRLGRPRARLIDSDSGAAGWEFRVNRLWAAMAGELADTVVGVRDAAWIRHRYLRHPVHDYRVHLLSSRLTGRAHALLVTRCEGGRLELVDMVCQRGRVAEVITVARQLAVDAGCGEVFAWITETQAAWLDIHGAERRPLDVEVPTSITVVGPSPEELQGRWWLMGGDTDFR